MFAFPDGSIAVYVTVVAVVDEWNVLPLLNDDVTESVQLGKTPQLSVYCGSSHVTILL